jgi:hypothetical protein
MTFSTSFLNTNYWSGETAAIAPSLEAVAKNYVNNNIDLGDMVCAFYTPDGLPQGYTMNVDGFLGDPNTEWEFMVYVMTHFGANCDNSQIKLNHCNDSTVACTDYVNSHYQTSTTATASNQALNIQKLVYNPTGYVDTSGGGNGKGVGLGNNAGFISSFMINGGVILYNIANY